MICRGMGRKRPFFQVNGSFNEVFYGHMVRVFFPTFMLHLPKRELLGFKERLIRVRYLVVGIESK